MLSEERQKRILSIVEQHNSVTVQQLAEELDASGSTVRRDLAELDSLGLLTKVHGGALAKDVVFTSKDDSVQSRTESHRDDKIRIARYAASLIQPDDFVYLDAGTTTGMMIDFLTCHRVVFVTNGFSHARRLSEKGYLTYILGGEIKSSTESVVGEEAMNSLSKYHFTKGFWGTNGISVQTGFSIFRSVVKITVFHIKNLTGRYYRYYKLNKRLNYVAGIGEDPIGTGTNVTKINWSNDEADSYPAWNNGSGAKVSLGTVITGYINSYNNIIDPVNEAQQSASQALGTSNAVSTSQYSIVEALEARLGYLYTFLNEKFGEGSFDYQTTTGDQKAFDDIPGNDA